MRPQTIRPTIRRFSCHVVHPSINGDVSIEMEWGSMDLEDIFGVGIGGTHGLHPLPHHIDTTNGGWMEHQHDKSSTSETSAEEDHGMGVWKNVRIWNAGLGPTKGEAKRLQEVGATVHRGKKLGPKQPTKDKSDADQISSIRDKEQGEDTLQTIQEDKETKVDNGQVEKDVGTYSKLGQPTAVAEGTKADAEDAKKKTEAKISPKRTWKNFKTWVSRISMTKKDTRMLHSVGATVHRGKEGRQMPSLSDKFEELRMSDEEASSPELQTLHNLEQRETLQPAYVLVYGTLKHGFLNHHHMKDAQFIGVARTKERYPMVLDPKRKVPCMLWKPGSGHQVKGEVWRVEERTLRRLDVVEGCPHNYRRQPILLDPEDLDLTGQGLSVCFAYFKAKEPPPAKGLIDFYTEEYGAQYVSSRRRSFDSDTRVEGFSREEVQEIRKPEVCRFCNTYHGMHRCSSVMF